MRNKREIEIEREWWLKIFWLISVELCGEESEEKGEGKNEKGRKERKRMGMIEYCIIMNGNEVEWKMIERGNESELMRVLDCSVKMRSGEKELNGWKNEMKWSKEKRKRNALNIVSGREEIKREGNERWE